MTTRLARHVFSAVCLVLALVACAGRPPQKIIATEPYVYGDPRTAGFGGDRPLKVVTGFQVGGRAPRERFGYYLYLAFGQRKAESESHRRAAVSAFLNDFESLSNPYFPRPAPADIAIFLMPASRADDLEGIVRERRAEDLLERYDYDFGGELMRRIHERGLGDLAILGSSDPIVPTAAIAPGSTIAALPLCGTPQDVQRTIYNVRTQVEKTRRSNWETMAVAAGKVLESLNALVVTLDGGEPDPRLACP